MGPFESLFATIVSAIASIGPDQPPAQPVPAEPVGISEPAGVLAEPPPLPQPRPDEVERVAMAEAVAAAQPQPMRLTVAIVTPSDDDNAFNLAVSAAGIFDFDVVMEETRPVAEAPADPAGDFAEDDAVVPEEDQPVAEPVPDEGSADEAAAEVPDGEAPQQAALADPIDISHLIPPQPRPEDGGIGGPLVAMLPDDDFAPPVPGTTRDACLTALASLSLQAAVLDPIDGPGACGIAMPLEIETVGSGRFAVDLTPSAMVDCGVASSLSQWLEEDVQPAARSIMGEWVTGIRVAASYACRGRNNDPNAQLSEHAYGNAIDISGFRLEDGSWVEVQPFADQSEPAARFLSAIRDDACGPFTTVLGPGVAMHDDHFHLDLASHGRSGDGLYCR